MSFKVRLFLGAPDFETLHVAKLREYPLEPRDYKPYAQARICFAADGLHVQLRVEAAAAKRSARCSRAHPRRAAADYFAAR